MKKKITDSFFDVKQSVFLKRYVYVYVIISGRGSFAIKEETEWHVQTLRWRNKHPSQLTYADIWNQE